MRGLKLFQFLLEILFYRVASYTDAWIEIPSGIGYKRIETSHPTRMRGLKFHRFARGLTFHPGSHPTRMRGLKLVKTPITAYLEEVASYTDAWIEI